MLCEAKRIDKPERAKCYMHDGEETGDEHADTVVGINIMRHAIVEPVPMPWLTSSTNMQISLPALTRRE